MTRKAFFLYTAPFLSCHFGMGPDKGPCRHAALSPLFSNRNPRPPRPHGLLQSMALGQSRKENSAIDLRLTSLAAFVNCGGSGA